MNSALQPCIRIGGKVLEKPMVTARLQTSGKYNSRKVFLSKDSNLSHNNGRGQVACVVESIDRMNTYRYIDTIIADSPKETEWASVKFGIQRALELNQSIIEVENNNLHIVSALMDPSLKLREDCMKYYRNAIYNLANQGLWVGICWTPYVTNDADALFHRQRATH